MTQALRWHPLSLVALLLALPGCESDDPAAPPTPRIVEFPTDAPTLQDALSRITRGDILQVAPGTHQVDAPLVIGVSGVTIRGRPEAERPVLQLDLPLQTAIAVDPVADGVEIHGLELVGTFRTGVALDGPSGEVRDCVIREATSYAVTCFGAAGFRVTGNLLVGSGVFGVYAAFGATGEVEGNTIVDTGDCGIYTTGAGAALRRNLIVSSVNYGVACFGTPTPTFTCNNIFGSGNAPYSSGCTPGADDRYDDPLFCGANDFNLSPASPCADANSPDCGQVGALGVGCTTP